MCCVSLHVGAHAHSEVDRSIKYILNSLKRTDVLVISFWDLWITKPNERCFPISPACWRKKQRTSTNQTNNIQYALILQVRDLVELVQAPTNITTGYNIKMRGLRSLAPIKGEFDVHCWTGGLRRKVHTNSTTLSTLLSPICSYCKIRNDYHGLWKAYTSHNFSGHLAPEHQPMDLGMTCSQSEAGLMFVRSSYRITCRNLLCV